MTVPEFEGCAVEDALRILTGKLRLRVLFRLGEVPQRFNALQRALSPATQKVLTTTCAGWRRTG